MKEIITTLITAVFNIVCVVLEAAGFAKVSEVLYKVMPYVNTIAVAILWFFGYQTRERMVKNA